MYNNNNSTWRKTRELASLYLLTYHHYYYHYYNNYCCCCWCWWWCSHRGHRDDIDKEDDQESYFRYMEENPTAGLINDEDDNIEYDEDGNAIIPDKKVWSATLALCVCDVSMHSSFCHCSERLFWKLALVVVRLRLLKRVRSSERYNISSVTGICDAQPSAQKQQGWKLCGLLLAV